MLLPNIVIFLKIIGFLLFSWVLIHFFAILGVFVAFAYPIWWFFAPKKTFCLFCRLKKRGEICPFCHQAKKEENDNYPKNFRSICLNSSLILIFSLTSFGLVFLEGRVVFKLGFPPTPKTVSFIIPDKGQFRLGEIFPMKIEINGIKTSINAVQADISFDPNKIEVKDISTVGSFADIFIQKEINNQLGYARLTGGLPNPGFLAQNGIFGNVYFQGKSPGIVEISFLPSSLVLANDGRGTNVLKDLPKASYLILPERVPEEELELQENLISNAVLGEKTEETQMKFYQEERVLGTEINPEIQKESKFSFWQSVYKFFEKIDNFILSFWGNIFSK